MWLAASLLLDVSRSRSFVHHYYLVLVHLGGFGLLILSVLDSSPLIVPLGNDLLMIAMTAKRHDLLVYYALMAAAGSVLGCLTVDALSRKGGEKGFEKAVPRSRFEYLKRRIKKNAAWTLAVASLVPPPFPFTAFVAGTAALQYPRRKLLRVVFFGRLARFLIEGVMAILFSHKLLRLARSPVVIEFIVALMVLSIAGSALAIRRWVKRSKTARAAP